MRARRRPGRRERRAPDAARRADRRRGREPAPRPALLVEVGRVRGCAGVPGHHRTGVQPRAEGVDRRAARARGHHRRRDAAHRDSPHSRLRHRRRKGPGRLAGGDHVDGDADPRRRGAAHGNGPGADSRRGLGVRGRLARHRDRALGGAGLRALRRGVSLCRQSSRLARLRALRRAPAHRPGTGHRRRGRLHLRRGPWRPGLHPPDDRADQRTTPRHVGRSAGGNGAPGRAAGDRANRGPHWQRSRPARPTLGGRSRALLRRLFRGRGSRGQRRVSGQVLAPA